MENQPLLPAVNQNTGFDLKEFLSFKRMITLQIIPAIYAIIVVIITLAGLGAMFSGGGGGYGRGFASMLPGGFFGGLIFIIMGNIAWRMWCEFILVLFRVNKNLQDIEANTRK